MTARHERLKPLQIIDGGSGNRSRGNTISGSICRHGRGHGHWGGMGGMGGKQWHRGGVGGRLVHSGGSRASRTRNPKPEHLLQSMCSLGLTASNTQLKCRS
jgi:hypothetical protein